jgi:hypothetical protein
MTTAQPTPLELRIAEVAQYEANIAMFKAILATLPTEWPEHLAQYKGATNKHETSAQIHNLDDVELVSKLWYADECFATIRAEMVEMQKAKAILAVLQNS